MNRFRYIKSFIFDKAQYLLNDGKGNRILMKIDYKNNKYETETIKKNGAVDIQLQKEVERMAEGLLKRKHRVNFAEKA